MLHPRTKFQFFKAILERSSKSRELAERKRRSSGPNSLLTKVGAFRMCIIQNATIRFTFIQAEGEGGALRAVLCRG